MRVYVIGPVTGRPDDNRKAFEDAAALLSEAGNTALIPHWFVPSGASWSMAMRRSIETMTRCDEVCALSDWRSSKGACIERRLAQEIGIPVHDLAHYAV